MDEDVIDAMVKIGLVGFLVMFGIMLLVTAVGVL